MGALPERIRGVGLASHLEPLSRRRSGWHLDHLSGRLVELTGGPDTAALSFAAGLVHQAQQAGEPVAWIAASGSLFYPPDFAALGIDLAALPIVRVERGLQAARAADTLIRSRGFGMVVLDIGTQRSMSLTVQTRLAALARGHDVLVLVLTRAARAGERREHSLGSLVSLFAETTRQRAARDRFACALSVRKDKRAGQDWQHLEYRRGPEGLC